MTDVEQPRPRRDRDPRRRTMVGSGTTIFNGMEAKQTKHVIFEVEQQISGDHFKGRHQKSKRLTTYKLDW